jgi:hypothetical protein
VGPEIEKEKDKHQDFKGNKSGGTVETKVEVPIEAAVRFHA